VARVATVVATGEVLGVTRDRVGVACNELVELVEDGFT
jgi:hypothetical protein